MGEPKSITYVAEQFAACAWYRCHTPGMALLRRGHDVVLASTLDEHRFNASDVLVFQRPSRAWSLEAIKAANEADKLTVVELDDDLWNIHPANPAYRVWNGTHVQRVLEECLRETRLVTVTTPALADLVRPMNRNIRVLPNMLPAEHWPEERCRPAREGRLTIGWAGSNTHLVDIMQLKGVIEMILKTYPGVEVVFVGLEEIPFAPHERLRTLSPVRIEEYPKLLDRFDIGLAPLVDGRFNQAKSDLKYLEYAMLGISVVASKVLPYEQAVRQGESGFLARNPKDWLKQITRLIEDAGLRDRIGEQARLFAETRLIDDNIGLWERAYGF